MSIWTIMVTLRRLHDAHGQLSDIKSKIETLNRAANFNARDPDSWDIFDMRDPRLTRILGRLNRVRNITRNLGRESGNVNPRHNAQARDLFMAWARLHADEGESARATINAKIAFLLNLDNWQGELTGAQREISTSRREMRRQRGFYQRIADNFADMAVMATRAMRSGLTTAHQAQAFSFRQEFLAISRSARQIERYYDAGLSSVSSWQTSVDRSDTDLQAWKRWSRNTRSANRSLERQRAPI